MWHWAQDKHSVQAAFEKALSALDGLGREPDPWEERCLVDALCSMASQQYDNAANEILKVAIAVRIRPPQPRSPERPRVTKEIMRLGLTHIRVHH